MSINSPFPQFFFSLFPLTLPTRANWQHAIARQDQILNSSRQVTFSPFSQSLSCSFFFFFYLSLLHLHTTTTTTFVSRYCFSLQTMPFPFLCQLRLACHLHFLWLRQYQLSLDESFMISEKVVIGPEGILFLFVYLFIYLSQLKLERLLMDIVLFYFIFILI